MYFLKNDIINIIKFIINKNYNNNIFNSNEVLLKNNDLSLNNEDTYINEESIINIFVELYNQDNKLKNDIINFINYLDEKINPNIKFKLLFINKIN